MDLDPSVVNGGFATFVAIVALTWWKISRWVDNNNGRNGNGRNNGNAVLAVKLDAMCKKLDEVKGSINDQTEKLEKKFDKLNDHLGDVKTSQVEMKGQVEDIHQKMVINR